MGHTRKIPQSINWKNQWALRKEKPNFSVLMEMHRQSREAHKSQSIGNDKSSQGGLNDSFSKSQDTSFNFLRNSKMGRIKQNSASPERFAKQKSPESLSKILAKGSAAPLQVGNRYVSMDKFDRSTDSDEYNPKRYLKGQASINDNSYNPQKLNFNNKNRMLNKFQTLSGKPNSGQMSDSETLKL
jgi:hypothetical protein